VRWHAAVFEDGCGPRGGWTRASMAEASWEGARWSWEGPIHPTYNGQRYEMHYTQKPQLVGSRGDGFVVPKFTYEIAVDGKRKYGVAPWKRLYDEILRTPDTDRFFYESYGENDPVHLMYDFDAKKEDVAEGEHIDFDAAMNAYTQAIAAVWNRNVCGVVPGCDTQWDGAMMDWHTWTILVADNPKKMSRHMIAHLPGGWMFKNARHMGSFHALVLLESIRMYNGDYGANPIFFRTSHGTYDTPFDFAIYGAPRQFRIAMCTKFKYRTFAHLYPPSGPCNLSPEEFCKSLVTFVPRLADGTPFPVCCIALDNVDNPLAKQQRKRRAAKSASDPKRVRIINAEDGEVEDKSKPSTTFADLYGPHSPVTTTAALSPRTPDCASPDALVPKSAAASPPIEADSPADSDSPPPRRKTVTPQTIFEQLATIIERIEGCECRVLRPHRPKLDIDHNEYRSIGSDKHECPYRKGGSGGEHRSNTTIYNARLRYNVIHVTVSCWKEECRTYAKDNPTKRRVLKIVVDDHPHLRTLVDDYALNTVIPPRMLALDPY